MRTIDIINDNGFYDDRDAHLLTDGDVELMVNLPPESGEYYFVAKNNGVSLIKIKLERGKPFNIVGLSAGVLSATIKHYLRGELIDVYPVEGLILKDVDGKVYGVPEVEHLKSKLADAEKRIQAIEQKNLSISQILTNLNNRIKNLEKINEGD